VNSPLDNRMRVIAREEAQALLGVPPGMRAAAEPAATTQQLQKQITDLHEHLHLAVTTIKRLEARLDALEKTAGQTDQEQTPTRRTRRKTTD
jgi:phage shock protein A